MGRRHGLNISPKRKCGGQISTQTPNCSTTEPLGKCKLNHRELSLHTHTHTREQLKLKTVTASNTGKGVEKLG